MATDLRLKENLPLLTERIVDTYAEANSIHHLGHCPLPNYDTVIAATEDLKEILYPGYRRRDGLHLGNVTYHVGELIDRMHDTLTEQIARALRHETAKKPQCDPKAIRDCRGPGPDHRRGILAAIAGSAQGPGLGRGSRLRRRPGLQIAQTR